MAFDEWDGKIKSYRIDKMMRISVTEESRTGKKEFKDYDMAKLSKSTFSMYGGLKKRVTIKLDNSMCGVFLDRFGKDHISFRPVDDTHSEFSVKVNVSPQFFGWIFGLGTKVKAVGPDDVVKELKKYGKEFLKNMNQREGTGHSIRYDLVPVSFWDLIILRRGSETYGFQILKNLTFHIVVASFQFAEALLRIQEIKDIFHG